MSMTSYDLNDEDFLKNVLSICKDSTHSISIPSFIVIIIEIAKLGKMRPSLFRLAKRPVQTGLQRVNGQIDKKLNLPNIHR